MAKFEGRTTGDGTVRGTTGQPKGPAQPTRPGFRDLPGAVEFGRRPVARRVERVTLPTFEVESPRAGLFGRLAVKVRNFLRRAVA